MLKLSDAMKAHNKVSPKGTVMLYKEQHKDLVDCVRLLAKHTDDGLQPSKSAVVRLAIVNLANTLRFGGIIYPVSYRPGESVIVGQSGKKG